MSNLLNTNEQSLDVNFDSIKGEFINLLIDYEKSSSKLLKILKIGERQQKKVKDLNDKLNKKTSALGELNEVLEYKFKLEVAKSRTKDKESLRILKSILDANPNPTLIYSKKGIVKATNIAFSEIITRKNILNSNFSLDSIIDRDSKLSILNSIDSFDTIESNRNFKVVLNCEIGHKIFNVIKKDITLRDNERGSVYTFNDITIIEYQRLMLEDYSRKLEGYLIQVKKESVSEVELNIIDEEIVSCDIEEEIVRRNRKYKLNAIIFMSEIDCEFLAELEDLKDILVEMGNIVLNLEKFEDITHIREFGFELDKFGSKIHFLSEFDDLIFGIKKLSKLLMDIDSNFTKTKIKKIVKYIAGIEEDLLNWHKSIFVTQNTTDIHYLDSSLLSSCIQIELILCGKDSISETSDFLEMF